MAAFWGAQPLPDDPGERDEIATHCLTEAWVSGASGSQALARLQKHAAHKIREIEPDSVPESIAPAPSPENCDNEPNCPETRPGPSLPHPATRPQAAPSSCISPTRSRTPTTRWAATPAMVGRCHRTARTITRMDAGIGRLFEQLKRTGKDRDTVVIFSSDSGPHQEGGHSPRTQHSGVWPVREKR